MSLGFQKIWPLKNSDKSRINIIIGVQYIPNKNPYSIGNNIHYDNPNKLQLITTIIPQEQYRLNGATLIGKEYNRM